jgi:hypothetical protein
MHADKGRAKKEGSVETNIDLIRKPDHQPHLVNSTILAKFTDRLPVARWSVQ